MLDLAADIETRIAHVYKIRPGQNPEKGIRVMRDLAALLRKYAKSTHEEYHALVGGIRYAAAAYHATTIKGWLITEDEAAKLFRLYQILGKWIIVVQANIFLRNLVCCVPLPSSLFAMEPRMEQETECREGGRVRGHDR
jgi:hypothetical protein